MNMKKVIFMIISAVLTLLYGCEKENGVNYVAVSVIVEYPADLISPQVVSEIFEFRNITTGNVTSYDRRDGILLPAGLYDCSYTAEVKHLFGSDTLTASVQGMTGQQFRSRRQRRFYYSRSVLHRHSLSHRKTI